LDSLEVDKLHGDDLTYSVLIENATFGYRVYSAAHKTLKLQLLKGNNEQSYKNVFTNLNFSIRKGESVGILGRNGAGKSTLVKAIAGAIKPSTGRIQTWGSLNSLIELGSGLNMDLSAADNVELHTALYDLTHMDPKKRVSEIMMWAGLEGKENEPLRTFSSGMLARFNFSLSTDYTPDLLILDEILSVGDSNFQAKSYTRTTELLNSGATIILVSHDVNTIKKFCNRGIYIEEGRIIADGSPEEVATLYVEKN
jgi:ABC-2 type transport system ATP-binding protein